MSSAPSHLVRLSREQQQIIDSFATHNLVVNAVAGSGKTTTILSLALFHQDKRFLMLTYNTRLCSETSERVKKHNIRNIQVFTYHSFMTSMTGYTVSTDLLLRKSLDWHF
jgi:superfamily I DNA/RNA helicase